MKPSNIYRINDKAIHQFSGNAEGFDTAVKQIKHHGVYIDSNTSKDEIPILVKYLRQGKNGTLVFIDESK